VEKISAVKISNTREALVLHFMEDNYGDKQDFALHKTRKGRGAVGFFTVGFLKKIILATGEPNDNCIGVTYVILIETQILPARAIPVFFPVKSLPQHFCIFTVATRTSVHTSTLILQCRSFPMIGATKERRYGSFSVFGRLRLERLLF